MELVIFLLGIAAIALGAGFLVSNGEKAKRDAYNEGVEDTKRFYENLRKEN